MGNMSGSYGSHYTLWQSITVNSQSSTNNTSNVTVRLYLSFDGSTYYSYTNYATSGEMQVNRWEDNVYASVGTYSKDSISFSSGQAKDILLAEWTDNVTHNDNGKKTLKVKGNWNTNTDRIGSGSCEASLELPAIARKGILKIDSVSTIGLNKATINYSHESGIFYHVQYSLNNGVWQDGTGMPMTITGLSPNTNYSVRVRALSEDRTIVGDASNSVSFSTIDIGRITSAPNITHGSSTSISVTNPSNSSMSLTMKIGSTTILTKTISTGNNSVSFTDSQLDTIYKLYGTQSSLTVSYTLTTAGQYTSTKTCTISLKRRPKDCKNKCK